MIEVKIPFQASLQFNNQELKVVGSAALFQRVSEIVKSNGANPKEWPLIVQPQDGFDFLINEFIEKSKNVPFKFNHEELCHCRAVSTQKVRDAIKAGCSTQIDVTRVTLAGSGCGSCRKDIDFVFEALKNPV